MFLWKELFVWFLFQNSGFNKIFTILLHLGLSGIHLHEKKDTLTN